MIENIIENLKMACDELQVMQLKIQSLQLENAELRRGDYARYKEALQKMKKNAASIDDISARPRCRCNGKKVPSTATPTKLICIDCAGE